MGKDSRAVLVLPGMPEKCGECPARQNELIYFRCAASGKVIPENIVWEKRPQDCPLRPIGEFMEQERREEQHGEE